MQDTQEAQYESIEQDTSVVESEPDFDSMMTDELRQIMSSVAEFNIHVKNAKTNTKKTYYKKKIAKLRDQAKVILYTQYLKGKKIPLDSSQNSVE